MKELTLSGKSLRIDDIAKFIASPEAKISLSQEVLPALEESRAFLEREYTEKIIYGVNTGFGPMSGYVISPQQGAELQQNLIRSHASGVGNPIPNSFVLAAMVVRLNTILRGHSGVSLELVESLRDMINARILPIVPEHGAVGTSGDLLQLAHIALGLIGEGKVEYEGKIVEAAKALKDAGLKPYVLKAKEGLSLINGTSAMSGIMSLTVYQAEVLLSLAARTGAVGLEMVSAFLDSFSKELSDVRPHVGQVRVAATLRMLTEGSKRIRDRYTILEHINTIAKAGDSADRGAGVQEFYSLRCIPQLLGPTIETLEHARQVLEVEINASTDNPILVHGNTAILHGGNFHGEYVAVIADQVKAALTKISMLSERRVNFFLSSHVNRFLPPFLNRGTIGLNLGLQALQFAATSTTAQNQSLSFPHAVHSIPTNADNQDVVSMGTDASLMCAKVLDNASIVIAIELVTLAQAADCLNAQDELSAEGKKLYAFVRETCAELIKDRSLSEEVTALAKQLPFANRFACTEPLFPHRCAD